MGFFSRLIGRETAIFDFQSREEKAIRDWASRQKSFGQQIDSLIHELSGFYFNFQIRIEKSNDVLARIIPQKEQKAQDEYVLAGWGQIPTLRRVLEIGNELHNIEGKKAMWAAYYSVMYRAYEIAKIKASASNSAVGQVDNFAPQELSESWHLIGEWQH